MKRSAFYVLGLMCLLATATNAYAQKKYGPGVTDTEIKIGQNAPFSGPASAYSIVSKVQSAYVNMINSQGGINGRKINLIARDDGYSTPKTIEVIRQLVEDDQVLAIVSPFGTAPNVAMQKYLNTKQVPQLLVQSGASRFNDPKEFPWTTPFGSFNDTEGEIFANYILKSLPNAKIGVLYQLDDIGKDYLKGLRAGLGDKATTMIVKEVNNQITDPTVDSQVLLLKDSGADVVFLATTQKFGAQAIRKINELGWKPKLLLTAPVNSITTVLTPAGLDASTGAMTVVYYKQPDDPTWANDKGMRDYLSFMKDNLPNNVNDSLALHAYGTIEVAMEILRRCGDDLTRENIIKQASNMKGFAVSVFIPGITLQTTPNNYSGVEQMQFARFDGKTYIPFGEVLGRPQAASK